MNDNKSGPLPTEMNAGPIGPDTNAQYQQHQQPPPPPQQPVNVQPPGYHNGPALGAKEGYNGDPNMGQQQYQNVTPLQALQMMPAPVECPRCKHRGLSVVQPETGNYQHALAALLCVFTLCCCWVPYVMGSLKDVNHKCASCGQILAKWHKSGHTDVMAHA